MTQLQQESGNGPARAATATAHLEATDEAPDWRAVLRIVHHELNNSLTPILSLAHTAPKLLARSDGTAKVERIFALIAERAEALRSFLADYAQLAQAPSPAAVCLKWFAFLDHLAGLVPFRFEVSPPDLESQADPRHMQQVLINLLKNAAESGSAAQDIRVLVRRTDDGAVEVLVTDRGPGLPADLLAVVGTPYFSTKQGGSGVGLALSRALVRAHKGELYLRNGRDGGVEVLIRLPGRESGAS